MSRVIARSSGRQEERSFLRWVREGKFRTLSISDLQSDQTERNLHLTDVTKLNAAVTAVASPK